MTGASLGRDGQLAGGNTVGILIVSFLILPLRIPLESWGRQLAELAVACADDKVCRQEGDILLVPPLPSSQLRGSQALNIVMLLYYILTSPPESIQGTHIF